MAKLHMPVVEYTDAELAQQLRTEREPFRLRALQHEALRRLPVRPMVGGGYVVASRSTKGAWWLVDPDLYRSDDPGSGCSCPATGRCWHIKQVELHGRLTMAVEKRDTPAPNVSALVD